MMTADTPDPSRGTGAESACIDAAEDARMLRELAGIGMRLVRLVEAQAQARVAEEPAAELGRADVAFARISRSIRQTLALKAKLAEMAAKRAAAVTRENRAQAADEARLHRRKARLARAVAETIDVTPHERDAEHLLADLHERLEDPDIAADLAIRSMGEMVASVCDDLGLGIDPDVWQSKGWYLTENWQARDRGAPAAQLEPQRPWQSIRDEALAMMEATTNPAGNGRGPEPPD